MSTNLVLRNALLKKEIDLPTALDLLPAVPWHLAPLQHSHVCPPALEFVDFYIFTLSQAGW